MTTGVHVTVAMGDIIWRGSGDGRQRDNGRPSFDGRGDGLWQGGGKATAAKIAFDGGRGGGLTVDGGVLRRRLTTKMTAFDGGSCVQ